MKTTLNDVAEYVTSLDGFILITLTASGGSDEYLIDSAQSMPEEEMIDILRRLVAAYE